MEKVIKELTKQGDNGFYAEIDENEIIIDCEPDKNTIKIKAKGSIVWPVAIASIAAVLLTIINKMENDDNPDAA
ncbi:hypothetical protein ACFL67_02915 [candidate division KSB1 bacterium]